MKHYQELVEAIRPNKITDKVNKVDGVYNSIWSGNQNKLTVYYYESVPLNTIKVRVADCLRDNFLDGSIEKVVLLSYSL